MGNNKAVSLMMLVMGTFSQTQVYIGGAMGLSELLVFAFAPIVFIMDINALRKDGFMPLLIFIVLSTVGCFIACLWNDVVFRDAARGYMANYGLWACVVVFHYFLRKDLNSFKWFYLGCAISWVLSTFWLQSATEIHIYGARGGSVSEGIISGPLFWAGRIGGFWVLPYQGWYLQLPSWLCFLLPISWGCISAVISEGSGRSMAICLLAAGGIAMVCGKTRESIRRVSRRLLLYLIYSVIGIFLVTIVYRVTASSGMLGEAALDKFNSQVKDAKSPLEVLMAGRPEFFGGLLALSKNPFVGYGPWAIDKYGVYEEFMMKHADSETIDKYYRYKEYMARTTGQIRYGLIPAHSTILQFWLWYGIFGGLLWIYILKKILDYIRHDMWAVPQYVGILAMGIPMQIWNIFFSPFGGRMTYGMFVVMLLMASAVRRGKISLTHSMMIEIEKTEAKYGKGRKRY